LRETRIERRHHQKGEDAKLFQKNEKTGILLAIIPRGLLACGFSGLAVILDAYLQLLGYGSF
jgi:hypothetical protein